MPVVLDVDNDPDVVVEPLIGDPNTESGGSQGAETVHPLHCPTSTKLNSPYVRY
ncbi:hypothetical protein [Mycobacterium leprae]|uniref:hypothetical protein n=1 Tax=Mycobacterium leprae TaxID=1769 RepID=UPI000ADF6DF1|nr:hypothetical protein [Mycobacterium leprae]